MNRFIARAACVLALCPAVLCRAQVWDFESGLPPGAVTQGEVALERDIVHGGGHALRLGRGAELLLPRPRPKTVSDRRACGSTTPGRS